MDLIKEKDFVMNLFLISFLFHSLSTPRFNKKKNSIVILLGPNSRNLVDFLMCRYTFAGHVRVCTLVSNMSVALLSEECV